MASTPLGAEPGGPLFVIFFLTTACAVATLTLRQSLLYTAGAAVLTIVIEPTFPGWSGAEGDLRDLGARLVLLAVFGASTAILTQRLALERETARSALDKTERLGELDRLRTIFVSSVSHGLRTPLTAAQAGLGLLGTSAADRLRPDERNLLENARRNTARLGLIIDDLLAYNQLEAGTLRLEGEPVDLRAVVTGAMGTLHPLIREKGQTLEIDLPEPLPAEGDPRRLEQVIVDLLHDAHQHTPEGTRIGISGRVADAEVALSVSDDGPGIPEGELEAVFRRFHRLGPTDDGSGLGLAIARGLVELHGGRIWAESRPGGGTSFRVALPLYSEGETMTLKLLIAEDARDVAEVVAFGARMTWPECEVTIASGGCEALSRFEEEQPGLVILDVTMPPPDGFEVCRLIRERSQVPILMLTVRDATLDKVRALDLGADDYLTKPFEDVELLARLRALLRRANGSPLLPTPDVNVGDLTLDSRTHEVRVRGEVVRLTSTEYRLLEVLVRHAGTVLPHRYLLERVWGPEYTGDTHYLKVFVGRLHRKLDKDPAQPRYIRSEWGVGYRFVPHR